MIIIISRHCTSTAIACLVAIARNLIWQCRCGTWGIWYTALVLSCYESSHGKTSMIVISLNRF